MLKRFTAILMLLAAVFSAAAAEPAQLVFNRIKGSPGAIPLRKNGNYLYAAGDKGFAVYDLKNPESPELVRLIPGINGRQMAVSGNILYVTARNQGLWIFDISNAGNPALIRRYDTVELATGIAVKDNLVFISIRIYGIEILDCSDPANPRHVGFIRDGELQSVAVYRNHLYGADWGKGRIHIWNISDLDKIRKVSFMQLDGFADGMFISGDLCYAATGMHAVKDGKRRLNHGHGLEIFNISDPSHPVRLGGIKFPPSPIEIFDSWTVSVSGSTAYVADTVCGVFVVDVKNPAEPKLLASGRLPMRGKHGNPVGSVAVGDGVIYAAGRSGGVFAAGWSAARPVEYAKDDMKMRLPEVKELNLPGFKRLDVKGQVRRLYHDGETLYAACSHKGIMSFRITDNGLVPLMQYPVSCSYDVIVRDGKIYSAEGVDGLAVYRISGNGKLEELGRDKSPAMHLFMGANSKFLFVTSGATEVFVKDVSDPRNIKNVFNKRYHSIFYTDTAADREIDGVLAVSCHASGTLYLDMNSETPRLKLQDTRSITCQRTAPCVIGGKIMLPAKTKGYILIDPQNLKAEPEYLRVSGLKNVVGTASTDGRIVVLTTRNAGSIYTLDFTNPEKASVIRSRSIREIPGSPGRAVIYRGRIFIPAGHSGILYETSDK